MSGSRPFRGAGTVALTVLLVAAVAVAVVGCGGSGSAGAPTATPAAAPAPAGAVDPSVTALTDRALAAATRAPDDLVTPTRATVTAITRLGGGVTARRVERVDTAIGDQQVRIRRTFATGDLRAERTVGYDGLLLWWTRPDGTTASAPTTPELRQVLADRAPDGQVARVVAETMRTGVPAGTGTIAAALDYASARRLERALLAAPMLRDPGQAAGTLADPGATTTTAPATTAQAATTTGPIAGAAVRAETAPAGRPIVLDRGDTSATTFTVASSYDDAGRLVRLVLTGGGPITLPGTVGPVSYALDVDYRVAASPRPPTVAAPADAPSLGLARFLADQRDDAADTGTLLGPPVR